MNGLASWCGVPRPSEDGPGPGSRSSGSSGRILRLVGVDVSEINLDAVIVTVTGETPRILTVRGERPALPSVELGVDDRTLELALRRGIETQTGLQVGYVEQLYTFGDLDRVPDHTSRLISVAYLALVRDEAPSSDAAWLGWYELFPWEDRRSGTPLVSKTAIAPALDAWVDDVDGDDRRDRRLRANMVFGFDGAPWDGVKVLERYELLYEVGLLAESPHGVGDRTGSTAMQRDHRRIVASALGRLRGKLTYRPTVFELLPPRFTLLQLQRLVEALAGVELHKQNFRRLVEQGGLVEGTGETVPTGGRPAELFRFRSDVLTERPRPGVGTPWRAT